ncbi:ABC transporter permease [Nocardia sp. NPDC020380]|uniref:ABC transporter permease n=1 Tax=Nocardia sp. NPDC020380 TaxID=3364309 RepID=UPI00378FC786
MSLDSTAATALRHEGERSGRYRSAAIAVLRILAGGGGWALFAAVLLVPVLGFLSVAVSPRLFDQGDAWFTLDTLRSVCSGWTARALVDTFLVGVCAAAVAVVVGGWLAWVLERTTLPGRPLFRLLLWALLLAPSYLESLGWTWLVEKYGVLEKLTGQDLHAVRAVVLGPAGVSWVLATRGIPFAVLSISAMLRSMGREYTDAARTHGAGRLAAARTVLPILAPALWAGFAIVFAESISDYGVAATMGTAAHFPLATAAMYQAIGTFPADFGTAAAVGWLLMALVALAIAVQRRATRTGSYAVLSGRTRPATRVRLRGPAAAGALAATSLVFLLAVGVPVLGAVLASFLPSGPGAGASVSLANYRHVLAGDSLWAPLRYSAELAAVVACAAVVFGSIAGRSLARGSARLLDLLLLAAIALPSVLLASGYIFTYDLPQVAALGLDIYGTVWLLMLGYLAGALPKSARLLSAAMSQINDNIVTAARVHGAAPVTAWVRGVLPLLATPLLWVWLVTFADTVFEFPISQMLAPPGGRPLSVEITRHLEGYDFGGGGALTVLAMGIVLLLIGAVLIGARLVLPTGRGLEGLR